MGLIVGISDHSELESDKLKDVLAIRSQIDPLSDEWMALCRFAGNYYQRPLGEVALPALPRNLRVSKPEILERNIKKVHKASAPSERVTDKSLQSIPGSQLPVLNPEQRTAVEQITQGQVKQPILLFGVTGSGKTEVYLQSAAAILEQSPDAQILILVPEINLTPQLENNIRQRFASLRIATLHSGMAEGQRLQHWLAAHSGLARIILGTRLAILASLPHLKLIIIDEEHDPSYKQQEGLRYSARDLAVWRAHKLGIPVVLGSATPSLESWYHAKTGRYQQLNLQQRAVQNAVLPLIKVINLEHENLKMV